ncbi:MAG: trigger factor [Ilumatobacteraceae bacterium]
MKSSVEPLEGNKVKLYVEVEEDEFDRDIDRAFRTIAKEVKLPGFRNGKAPRQVLEARIGIGPAREQALRDSVPEYLAKAIREHDVDLIAQPDVEITGGHEDGPVEFDATCEVRPQISVPGYGGLRVEVPSITPDPAEVDEAIQTELRGHGGLESLDRPAAQGDFVTLDLAATRGGEDVAGLNTEDWSYEIGQGWVADDFDDQLVGATAGDVLRFTTAPRGTDEPADFVVTVSAVQELVVPELTDEWVGDNFAEYETVDEWRESVVEGIRERRLNQARSQVVSKLTDSLAQLVDIEPPESLVNNDLQRRVQNTVQQFQAQGIDLEAWLSATGQDPSSFMDSLKVQSEQSVKVDLALRAVADAEELEVEPDEIDAEYTRIAMQVEQTAKDVRKAYEKNDAVPELVAQLRKSKALEWLLRRAEIVDPDGAPVDRAELLPDLDDDAADADAADDDVDADRPSDTPSEQDPA